MTPETIFKYGFLLSTAGLIGVYLLYQARGRKLDKALSDYQMVVFASKVAELHKLSEKSQENFEHENKEYEGLKHDNDSLLHKLGVGSEPKS